MGYSQGGIIGGAASALSNKWTRAILGVPGMNYAGLLLNRSIDWNTFKSVYNVSYKGPVEQQVVLQLAQLLWDRGENQGYAQHLTARPYTGLPAKQVFIIENYGDHQVANVGSEMLARTIGAGTTDPRSRRSSSERPRARTCRRSRSGVCRSSTTRRRSRPGSCCGTTARRPRRRPTTRPTGAAFGSDPHGYGRGNAKLLNQITTFLTTGVIPNECGTAACQSQTP